MRQLTDMINVPSALVLPWQGLTELACMNCSCISLAVRLERLAQLEGRVHPQPAQRGSAMSPKRRKRHRPDSREASGRCKCRKIDPLAQKLDILTSEFAEMKTLLQNLQQPGAQSANALATAAPPQSPSEMLPPILSPALEILEEDVLSTRASDSSYWWRERRKAPITLIPAPWGRATVH